MVEKQAIARLNREFALLQKSNNPQFTARPCETDTLIWHYVIFNLPKESPYYGGQYHGKLAFPREYPLKPPSIFMTTPSGRFEVGKRLCLSMSDYHPETWNPSWRVETILLGLVSFMLDESDPATAGGLSESCFQRRVHALLSFFRNQRSREFRELFPELMSSERYFIGIGYIRPHENEAKSQKAVCLKDCLISKGELDSITSIDDLNKLVTSRGIKLNPPPDRDDKAFLTLIFPWLAIGIVGGAWFYSQVYPP
jgi:ubiquitin-conjugating enzyme E2 J2